LVKEVAKRATLERLKGDPAGINTGGAEGIRELFKRQKPRNGS